MHVSLPIISVALVRTDNSDFSVLSKSGWDAGIWEDDVYFKLNWSFNLSVITSNMPFASSFNVYNISLSLWCSRIASMTWPIMLSSYFRHISLYAFLLSEQLYLYIISLNISHEYFYILHCWIFLPIFSPEYFVLNICHANL